MKKKLIRVAWLSLIIIMALTSIGCLGISSESRAKRRAEKLLEVQYGGDFIVYKAYYRGKELWAEAAWAEIPEHSFTIATQAGSSTIKSLYQYAPYEAYISKGIEETIKEDINRLFPNAFYRVDIAQIGFTNHFSLNSYKTYKDLLKYSLDETWCTLDIFIPEDIGTNRYYEEEYLFFTETVNEYISDKRMCRVAVDIHWMDTEAILDIETYLQNSDTDDDYYLIVDKYPHIRANFNTNASGFIGTYEEYKKRREEIEK